MTDPRHPSVYRVGEPVRIVNEGKYSGKEGVIERADLESHKDVPYVVRFPDVPGEYNAGICFGPDSLEAIDLDWADVGRAVEIGQELEAISRAIDEAQIGFTNAHMGERYDFYSTRIFRALSNHREAKRAELVALGPELEPSDSSSTGSKA